MKVVILAGGYGTRLSEETMNIPKPLVEVAGKPLIWYIMKAYASQGYNDFVVASGYKAEKIREYFATSPSEGWDVTVVDTGLNTMTGGRIKRVAGYLDGDTFMLTYGDGVSDINLEELLKFHRAHGKKATVTAVRMPRFGIVNIGDGGKVTSFQEKRLESSPYINGGFMVLSKSVIDYIEGDDTAFETTPLQRLAEDGELYAYKYDGFWKCVDTLRDKQELEQIMNSNDMRVRLWKD